MHNLFKRSLTASLVMAMFLAAPVWAQETGSISGTVTDPDGAPLPGVAVTLNSVAPWCRRRRFTRRPTVSTASPCSASRFR